VPPSQDAVAEISFVTFCAEIMDNHIFDFTIEGGVTPKCGSRIKLTVHFDQGSFQKHDGALDSGTCHHSHPTIYKYRSFGIVDYTRADPSFWMDEGAGIFGGGFDRIGCGFLIPFMQDLRLIVFDQILQRFDLFYFAVIRDGFEKMKLFRGETFLQNPDLIFLRMTG